MPVRWDLWLGHQKWTKLQWVTLRNVIELAEDSYRLRLALTFRARLLRHTAR